MSNTNDIAALKANNGKYIWHPMAHPKAMLATPPDIIARGEGCWVWDVDGHKLLDGVGGLWSANLGHSNQAVRNAVIARITRDTLEEMNPQFPAPKDWDPKTITIT